MKLTAYALKMIEANIRVIERHVKKAEKGNETALHQFRVNIRRLQNALKLFKKLFPQIVVEEWLIEIKYAIQETNEVRDLDVYIKFLKEYYATLEEQVEKNVIKAVINQLVKKRKKRQQKVIKVVKGVDKTKLFEKIDERLRARARFMESKKEEEIYSFCAAKVLKRLRDLLDFEKFIDEPKRKNELHKLRIKNKHLRYTLEELRKIYDNKINIYIHKVTAFHHLLGDIHDYDVWVERMNKLLKKSSLKRAEREILNKLKEYCEELRNKSYQEFCIKWHEAREAMFYEQLGEYIYSFQGEAK